MFRRFVATALVALLTALGVPHGALGADCTELGPDEALVAGCFDGTAGTIGMGELRARVGESIAIPIEIHGEATVDAFSLDLSFPSFVRYDSTTAGALLAGFDQFGSFEHSALGMVRIAGFEVGSEAIVAGETGAMAWVHFTVVSPGCAAFSMLSLVDDLEDYDACVPDGTTPTPISSSSWGQLKGRYR